MTRKYNFYAGPATLPYPVLEQIRDEITDYHGAGMSLIETSHRSKDYDAVHYGAMNLLRELLGLPDNYKVLFLQGGATLQFSMVPMNLLYGERQCDFAVTGTWTRKALADAKRYGKVNVIWDGKESNYSRMPAPSELQTRSDSVYLHLCSNETIGGIQFHDWADTDLPIVCDMSSDILSRPLPLEKFGLIFAGAQKNLGPAGVSLVIIRDDMLEQCGGDAGAYLKYATHAPKDSLYNTPPVFSIYALGLVLQWVKDNGGLAGMAERADARAGAIYGAVEQLSDFYRCPVDTASRSKMNIVFRLPTEALEKKFIADALAVGMVGLKGHRDVGGCRASVYNSMPVEGALALADFMGEFARAHG